MAQLAKENDTDVVARGKFVREVLLCQPLPPPRHGQRRAAPPDGKHTQRERMAQHSADATCAGCHKLMDPLGLAFERYDGIGRYRTTDVGQTLDISGKLTGAEPEDAPFDDAVGLMKLLAKSPTVQQCFVTTAFRYALGRDAEAPDRCALERLQQAVRGTAAATSSIWRWPSPPTRASSCALKQPRTGAQPCTSRSSQLPGRPRARRRQPAPRADLQARCCPRPWARTRPRQAPHPLHGGQRLPREVLHVRRAQRDGLRSVAGVPAAGGAQGQMVIASKFYNPFSKALHGNQHATLTVKESTNPACRRCAGRPGASPSIASWPSRSGPSDAFSSTASGRGICVSADGPRPVVPSIASPGKAFDTYFGGGQAHGRRPHPASGSISPEPQLPRRPPRRHRAHERAPGRPGEGQARPVPRVAAHAREAAGPAGDGAGGWPRGRRPDGRQEPWATCWRRTSTSSWRRRSAA